MHMDLLPMNLHNPQLRACLEKIQALPDFAQPTQNLPPVLCPKCQRKLLLYGQPGRYWAAHPLCGGACKDDLNTYPRAATQEEALIAALDVLDPVHLPELEDAKITT